MISEAQREEWAEDATRSRQYIGDLTTVTILGKLANAVETLLRENAELTTAVQSNIAIGERTADKLTLANRRIEKLRQDASVNALVADDVLGKLAKEQK